MIGRVKRSDQFLGNVLYTVALGTVRRERCEVLDCCVYYLSEYIQRHNGQ